MATPAASSMDLPAESENPSRRPQRNHRLPARYRDTLPESIPANIGTENAGATYDQPVAVVLRRVRLIVRDSIQTVANTFGLFREYQHRPSYDPDSTVPSDDLAHVVEPGTNTNNFIDPDTSTTSESASSSTNVTTELLLNWQNSGSELKSHAEVNRLVEVLRHPDFAVEDLKGFEAARANRKQDEKDEKSSKLEGFQETTVKIDVPSGDKDIPSRIFEIPGFQFRNLITLIKSAFTSPLASKFHFSPFRLYHQTSSAEEVVTERVYSELYNSEAFIKEHDRVQRAPLPPDEPGCRREKAVAALMFWSDSTHLAQFGMAKLWPIYMLLGNLSKYTRGEPSSKACQHVAYIPTLPDSLQDMLASWHPKWKTQKKHLLTHCRRELMHAVWSILLDDEFLHAYTYGVVIKCHDGVERRVYPRIFTYSADYPEK
jgi:hypothetical protein